MYDDLCGILEPWLRNKKPWLNYTANIFLFSNKICHMLSMLENVTSRRKCEDWDVDCWINFGKETVYLNCWICHRRLRCGNRLRTCKNLKKIRNSNFELSRTQNFRENLRLRKYWHVISQG